jgi:ABC-2 type transport system ATP-binding protein
MVDRGRVVAEGSPAELKSSVGGRDLDEAFLLLTEGA